MASKPAIHNPRGVIMRAGNSEGGPRVPAINTRANPSGTGTPMTPVTRAPSTNTVMRTGSWAWAQGRTSNKDASSSDPGPVGSPPVGSPPQSPTSVQRPQLFARRVTEVQTPAAVTSPTSPKPMPTPTPKSTPRSPITPRAINNKTTTTPAPTPTPEPVDDEKQKKAKEIRKKRVQEIVETERTYVNSLREIHKLFITPLRDEAREAKKEGRNPILTANQLTDIFSNWETILNGHNKILLDMENKFVENWHDGQLVGALFTTPVHVATFKLYRYYVNNYDNSIKHLKQHKASHSTFSTFIDETEPQLRGLSLGSFLIQPIQRIPRFIMLVSEVLKETPTTHADHVGLQQAKEVLEGVALLINESKKKSEQEGQTLSLCARIKGFPARITSEQRILKHGVLSEIIDGFFYKTFVVLLQKSLILAEIIDEKKGEFRFVCSMMVSQIDMMADNSNVQPAILIVPTRSVDFICAVHEDTEWGLKKGFTLTASNTVLRGWWQSLASAMRAEILTERQPKYLNLTEQMAFSTRRQLVHEFQQQEMDYSFKLKFITKSNLRGQFDGIFTTLCSLSDFLHDCHSTLVNKLATQLSNSKLNPPALCIGKAFLESIQNFEAEYDLQLEPFFVRMTQKVYQAARLLLETLLLTPPSHADYGELTQAEAQVRNLGMKIIRSIGPLGKKQPLNEKPLKRSAHLFTSKTKDFVQ